ncbi:MAG TPA: nuclear transport factor 2 family protein [Candidatus Brocadiia bacterium]|nr:nuclear transport factor 2 family protein [Candidatus Brocadiia bacterium]
MDQKKLVAYAGHFLSEWNTQDFDRVSACYTEDVEYRDPNTRGVVRGADAMRRYLRKLFAAWDMQWSLRECHPLAEREGAVILWHAAFRKAGGSETVEADGIDIVMIRDGRIERNEVHFDRSALLKLLTP